MHRTRQKHLYTPALECTRLKKSTRCLPHDLLVDKLLQLLLAEVVLVLIKVKELLGNRGSGRLIIGVMVWLQVWVLEGLLDCDALDRVEGEELF